MLPTRVLTAAALLALCGAARPDSRACTDCRPVRACPAAAACLSRKDVASIMQLRNAFCGYLDDTTNTPKVCCSDFLASPAAPAPRSRINYEPDDDSATETDEETEIDEHENLRLLPERCGKTNGKRIIGGSAAGLYELPWMALIAYNRSSGYGVAYKCSGTLISARYVLTAAHCVRGQRAAGVRVGDYNVDTHEDCVGTAPARVCETRVQDRQIEKTIIHEQYIGMGEAKSHDIALLRLQRPIRLSKHIQNAGTICLPTTRALRSRNITGEVSVVAGWGLNDNMRPSPVLLKVELAVYGPDECREHVRLKDVERERAAVLCAGEEGKDSCKGDSGSPLIIESANRHNSSLKRYVQYGIVSHGPISCGVGTPGIYTDVTKYMKWILDNMEE